MTDVHFSDRIERTPVCVLALEGQRELIVDRGYPASLLVTNSQSALWIEDEMGAAAACIVFSEEGEGHGARLWIWLSYTRADQRRHGLHTKLWKALEDHARKNGVRAIEGAINIHNIPMLEAARSNGRQGEYLVFRKDVEAGPT